jgi:hypothetical protein
MPLRTYLVALLAAVAVLAFAGTASAAFPNYSDCPRTTSGVVACLDIQSITGSLEIKGFTVPLGNSLEIRGGLKSSGLEGGPAPFVPPAGTNGFFSKPIRIPGGLLGLELPIPGNTVLGTAQLAGPASSILITFGIPVAIVSIPVKVRLDNPLLGSDCFIGTNGTPVRVNLTTGTTSPPPPNRPISGSIGTPVGLEDGLQLLGAVSVDNAFSIPGASGCGLFGILDGAVNLKLKLPSAAGNNTMIVENNIGLRSLS